MFSKEPGKTSIQQVALKLPPLIVSLATAQVFFKFKSFFLEALAFLALWFVLHLVYTRLVKALTGVDLPLRYNLVGLAYVQLLPLASSLLIASLFFQFKSFLLEALAFLVVWYVLGVLFEAVLRYLNKQTGRVPAPESFHS
ncbi:MAG: hypothetical protein JWP00_2555 [Chloroflexi bacterium]|nr:hypothetical protein [Chloroflexota bacterium]